MESLAAVHEKVLDTFGDTKVPVATATIPLDTVQEWTTGESALSPSIIIVNLIV